jgi:hypothetical protein
MIFGQVGRLWESPHLSAVLILPVIVELISGEALNVSAGDR